MVLDTPGRHFKLESEATLVAICIKLPFIYFFLILFLLFAFMSSGPSAVFTLGNNLDLEAGLG